MQSTSARPQPGHNATLYIESNQQLDLTNFGNVTLWLNSNGNLVLGNNISDTIQTVYMETGPQITNSTGNGGPATQGAATITIGSGSVLTLGGNIVEYGLGDNSNNTTPATISGGTLALNLYGASGTHTTTMTVNAALPNDMTNSGGDLNISSAIVDGSGLINTDLNKFGQGVLVLSGSTANTFSGVTAVDEGMLVLAKTNGVTAIGGPLIVGDNSNPAAEGTGGTTATGWGNSQIVLYRGSNQMPAQRVRHG